MGDGNGPVKLTTKGMASGGGVVVSWGVLAIAVPNATSLWECDLASSLSIRGKRVMAMHFRIPARGGGLYYNIQAVHMS